MGRGKRQGSAAPADASAAASASEPAKGKNRVSGSLMQLILQAFEFSNPRKSLSLAAVKKFVAEAGCSVSKNNSRLKRELRPLVSAGLLTVTGSGTSGSFKFSGDRANKKIAGGGGGGSGEAEKGKRKNAAASAGTGQPEMKARKEQPAVNKPKGLQGRASAAPDRKRQLNKRPTTNRRPTE